jgi:hypothetical protein
MHYTGQLYLFPIVQVFWGGRSTFPASGEIELDIPYGNIPMTFAVSQLAADDCDTSDGPPQDSLSL